MNMSRREEPKLTDQKSEAQQKSGQEVAEGADQRDYGKVGGRREGGL